MYSQNSTSRKGDVEPSRDDAGRRYREQTSEIAAISGFDSRGIRPSNIYFKCRDFHSRHGGRGGGGKGQLGSPPNVKIA